MTHPNSPTRRVLFLDVDGCASPSRFTGPTVLISGDWNGTHPVATALLHELQQLQSDGVEIVLSTSWEDEATEALAPHLGTLHTLHAVQGDSWWKTRAINEYLAAQPASISLMIDDEAAYHPDDLPDVSATIIPEAHLGLTPAHLAEIRSTFFDTRAGLETRA